MFKLDGCGWMDMDVDGWMDGCGGDGLMDVEGMDGRMDVTTF